MPPAKSVAQAEGFIESVLILGASSDIGMELLRRLDGRVSLILAHANRGLERLRRHAAGARSKVVCLRADLRDPDQVADLLLRAVVETEFPSAIVHLAAPRMRMVRFKETAGDDFLEDFQVQVQGPAQILRAFLPKMAKAGRGDVLFLLSSVTLGEVPAGLTSYVTSKFALVGLLNALTAEYGRRGIRCSALSPGMTDTAFLRNLHPSVVEATANASPLGRNLSAAEVAERLDRLLEEPEGANGVNLEM